MKTDNYLTLCLEQAAKSPLRYRHGCIIVRGGKVIGQGYNDFRPGFNGGALKTGRLSARADRPAIEELKEKLKMKRESTDGTDREPEMTGMFTPFEGMGASKHANTPLSMHSEMMAIHSALSASSTLASSAVSSKKPCLKLPGSSKRKTRLRHKAVKVYVETVCKAALSQSATEQRNGLSNVQEWRFEGPASQSCQTGTGVAPLQGRGGRGGFVQGDQNRETPDEESEEQWTHEGPSAHWTSRTTVPTNVYNLDNAEYDSDIISGSNETKKPTRHSISETSKNTKAHLLSAPKAQPVLTLKGHTGLISRSVTDRKKYPRLVGADLYVARLGWKAPPNNANSCCGSPKELDDISTSPPKPLTGSLHDELINPVSKSTSTISLPVTLEKQPSVLASRPCYRCISYMNSVGIKRVFWTTDTGMWEGAKVRDLIDAMEDLACADTTDTAAAVNNVFVTKHEVLMLRRTMGDI